MLSHSGGLGRLGLLTVCFTLPVFLGGLLVGPLLDRFDKRYVLAADSVLRGAAVASIPVAAVLGRVPTALPFVVAATYGLLKMVPLAGFPAAIPDLVRAERLDAANALESLGFGLAGMIGPALAGLLLAVVGAETVLVFDAASHALFAWTALAVRRPLGPDRPSAADRVEPGAARAGLAGLLRDRVLVTTTVAFMAFNIAEGMSMVTGPWLARTELPGGPRSLGLLLAALSVGELVGAAASGALSPGAHRIRAMAPGLALLVGTTGVRRAAPGRAVG
ncbi:MFS transporter [Embleya sp. AB8]|uniref:MFS transporter n=1 Tax=Embleya sp. AB8 TaxID=3156304 RepID=UPI003C72D239